jgi:hypothetical protein
MLTGTPLDLTPFGGLLAALGGLYWLAALAVVLLALWWPKRWWLKLLAGLAVSGAVVYPLFVRPAEKRVDELRQEQAQFKARQEAAMAHYEMRCKSAGEKIIRTVDNVEGVVWMKWREKAAPSDDADQFKLFDPYGRDCTAEECIAQLLRASDGLSLDPAKKEPYYTGYRFVETVDPSTKQVDRYTRRLYRPHDREAKYTPNLIRAELVSEPIKERTARYGITWDDISTREDREMWIAGGSLKVIDLLTNEVIGERVGYMMDQGQGNRSGARTPWLFAQQTACPPFPQIGPQDSRRRRTYEETVTFASKVLLSNQ